MYEDGKVGNNAVSVGTNKYIDYVLSSTLSCWAFDFLIPTVIIINLPGLINIFIIKERASSIII